jgi:hypothetical protein
MFSYRNLFGFATALFLAVILGCSDPGPAERAGEKVDEAVESVKEALDPSGPAEKAGRKIDETMEDIGEALESAPKD